MEIDLEEIIKRIDFMTDCNYAEFHTEFKRGLNEAIRVIRIYQKEINGTS